MDEFTKAYIEAMFFTEDSPELEGLGLPDLCPASLADIVASCADFQKDAEALLADAAEAHNYDLSQAGHDFWLTRNRHGAGFWDRGLGETGTKLTALAHAAGTCILFVADTGKIHVAVA